MKMHYYMHWISFYQTTMALLTAATANNYFATHVNIGILTLFYKSSNLFEKNLLSYVFPLNALMFCIKVSSQSN